MGPAQPLYFVSRDRQLFGWLHEAREPAVDFGLLICNPFGYEAICAHRSIRSLAEGAANLGVSALRFDYSGTGDSEDVGPTFDQIELWTQDVTNAAAELQRLTGVSRVCVLGIRLGGMLAMLAARQSKAIDTLILVAPVIQGERYLRELRTMRLAGGGDRESASSADELEVSGFLLSPASQRALADTDLSAAFTPPPKGFFVLEDANLPTSRALMPALPELTLSGRHLKAAGLLKMLTSPTHLSNVPQAMLDTVRHWLVGMLAASADSSGLGSFRAVAKPPLPATKVTFRPESDGRTEITERALFLGSNKVFGIVTHPVLSQGGTKAVLLLNQGANHHIGGGGLHVSLARSWASRGDVVLRMDLAGIGDSPTLPGRINDEVFPDEALDDIRSAVEFLQGEYGVTHITLGGLCSGGFHALHAAIAKLKVDRILAINPQNYHKKKNMVVHKLQLAQLITQPWLYYRRIFSYSFIRRFLAGKTDFWGTFRISLNSIVPYETMFRKLALRLGLRLQHDLGRELQEVTQRGVRVVFIFAQGEMGINLLKLEAGSALFHLGDSCRIHTVESGDHSFSQSASRVTLQKLLDDELAC